MGKVHLNSKDYKRAAQYYSAVIQTIEGHNGNLYADLRRRCLLTLAECEIRNGNLFHAIARCSEILNECPDPSAALDAVNNLSSLEDHDTDFLQNVMSKAFFRAPADFRTCFRGRNIVFLGDSTTNFLSMVAYLSNSR